MEIETFEHNAGSGWSVETFPDLDSERTLVTVFGSREYLDDDRPLRELADAYPRSSFAGCSSSGEIHQERISDGTLSVAVTRFEHGDVGTAVETIESMEDSRAVGRRLGERLAGDDLTAVLVFSKGVEVNGTALVDGINEILGPEVTVTGGLAGDADRFETTWVFDGERPREDAVVAVGLYGDDFVVTHGSQGGWDQFGPEREITRSEANVLYELDGKPALEVYKRYLGDQADDLPASALLFPLQLTPADRPEEQLVRTVLDIDEETGSMTFAGDVPEGSTARLMKVNFDRLVEAASDAAGSTASMAQHSEDEPVLGLAISCVGRRLVLKERTASEVEAVLENLPDTTRLVGFYSYGELSPFVEGESCALHNQTMTLTAISET